MAKSIPTDPTQSHVSPWVYPLIQKSNRLVLPRFFGPIKVQGQEHLPVQGPMVLAIKHYSRWDPMVISLLRSEAIRFMTNANQFEGIQGWLLPRLGAFPIDLARPQKSSMKFMINLLQQGEVVGIFPEGGIVRDQLLRPLKPGLARLILQAEGTAKHPLEVSIVPIALRYIPTAQRGATIYIDISAPFNSLQFQAGSDRERATLMTQHLEGILRDRLTVLHHLPDLDTSSRGSITKRQDK